MRLGLFGRNGARPDDEAKIAARAVADRLKADIRRLLDLPEQASVAVNEIICADPACPGSETVILVMKPGARTRAYKLQMAMAEVTAEAMAEAFDRASTEP
jgi:hypothetical protein